MPYGTLDIRLRKSATRYYYLQPDRTFSYRESSPGVKTNTYRDMTSWDSSPYSEGNLREKNGAADYFILNYRLLFPLNYQQSYSPGYPLIIMMHGLGERGNCWDTNCHHATTAYNPNVNDPAAPTTATHELLNNDHNLLHGGGPHLNARNLAGNRLPDDPSMPDKAFPGFVLFPQNLNGWSVNTVHDVIRLVRLVEKKYNVDPDRIYIHGLSNGGSATYEVIKRAPWLFAAALPMSAPSDASIISKNLTGLIANIPLWIFQGAIDTNPTPFKTEGYIKKFKEAGMSVRYTKYSNLGHGVWNTAYADSDFFKFMLSTNKANVQVFADNPAICNTNGKGVTMRLADGFYKYQWEKDGAVISGATAATYVATTPGNYRARFSRVPNPGSGDWNQWSQVVTVTEQNPATPKLDQIGTVLLKGLDNYGNARLVAPKGFDHYYWYKNGAKITISDTVRQPIFKAGDCSTGVCAGNGVYTVVVAGFDNCPSPESNSKTVFFNNQAPTNLTAPGNFQGAVLSSTSARLTWTDASSGEVGFEIWRRKVTGSGTYSTWSMPKLTGANAVSVTDSSLEPSSTYQYKIRAVGTGGRSNYTPSASTSFLVVTTSGDSTPPTVPGNLTVAQTGVGQLTLNWTASSDNTGIREYVISYGGTTVNTGSSAATYVLKNLPLNQSYSITIRAKDLGGNLSGPSGAASGSTFVEGLYYEHSTGAWTSLNDINWNIVEFRGKVTSFTLTPRTQEDYFNFRFDGYLYIDTGGSYQFSTVSSDGSRVEIDGVVVVENDGIHGTRTVTGPVVSLSSGPKRIIVKYFEYDGSQTLTVRYKGPDTDGSTVTIPATVLRSSPWTSGSSVGDVVVMEETSSPEERINVYPNPASAMDLRVKIEDAPEGPVRIRLMDFSGRSRYDRTFESELVREGVQLEATDPIPDGIYIIAIEESGLSTKKKIIIKN